MSRVLIIGYGNPLRGDDAFGQYAANRLADSINGKDVSVLTCHQLTPELAEIISGFDKVIFIDASVGDTPGTLTVTQLDTSHIPNQAISHQLDPESVLACSEHLFGQVPESYLVTVTADSFEYMEDLSVPVKTSIPDVTEAVMKIVGCVPAK